MKENIQNIIQIYTRLYEATGGLVEVKKSFYYVWQWSSSGVKEKIKTINMDIEINGVKLKQLGTKDTIRILGLFINPSLR